MFFSPLEQFQILPVISLYFLNFIDLSITHSLIIISLALFFFSFIFFKSLKNNKNIFIIPNRFQLIVESIFFVVLRLILDNIGLQGKVFFQYIFTLFVFLILANLIGLIPYSFTITSHLIVALFLALGTFFAINIICFSKHSLHAFSLFLPAGSSITLALLLIPIEIVSYIFRPISLSVRLFANMMAGHTLLKVIAGFAWSMMLAGSGLVIAHFIPIIILTILMALEFGVAVIQAYVFTILICIYLKDALFLH